MKNPFCHFGIHRWEYRREKHNVKGHPTGRECIRVIVRECKWCGHREHHMLPRANGRFHDWRPFDDVKKEDEVEFNRVCK